MKLFGNATLKCSPIRVSYDFENKQGMLLTDMEKYADDMDGTIKFFTAIDPKVRVITVADHLEDMSTWYVRDATDDERVAR